MRSITSFFRNSWSLLLFGFASVFFGNFGQSFFVGIYSESIKSDLQLSASAYGSIYSAATFLAGFVFLYAGSWIDKRPLQQFSLVISVGMCVACVFLANAQTPVFLFLGFLLVRLFGQSLLPHAGVVTMARMFHHNRGKALGVAASAVPVGEIVLPFMALILIGAFGWQKSWLIYAGMVLAIYAPLAYTLLRGEGFVSAESPIADPEKAITQTINGRFSLLKSAQFWRVLPALMYGPFVVTGVFIHQDFIIEEKAWPVTWWAGCFIFYGAVHWLSSISVGVFIDRFSARKLLAWYNLPIVLSVLTLVIMPGDLSALVFLGLLGVTIGCGGPIGSALWAEVYGTKFLGGIRSMVSAFAVVSTAISPILMGYAIDNKVSFALIVYTTGGVGVVTAFLSATAYKIKPLRGATTL